ncbi:hypothetical protein PQR15_37360 [Streptomyces lydicus]|nr:hypothetical protein [Streptomyces lydicus]
MTVTTTGAPGGADRFRALLPAHLWALDDRSEGTLQALLSAVAEELAVLEGDLGDLYDGWFVETCEEWLLPYVADLIGLAEPLPDLGDGVSWRTVVANTLSHRRRKGTATVLEQLAGEVTGWQARAVEYFRLLAVSTHVRHPRPDRPAVASLRHAERLDHLGRGHDRRVDRSVPPPDLTDPARGASTRSPARPTCAVSGEGGAATTSLRRRGPLPAPHPPGGARLGRTAPRRPVVRGTRRRRRIPGRPARPHHPALPERPEPQGHRPARARRTCPSRCGPGACWPSSRPPGAAKSPRTCCPSGSASPDWVRPPSSSPPSWSRSDCGSAASRTLRRSKARR